MSLCIIGLTICATFQVRFCKRGYFELAKDEEFGIEQENEIMPIYRNFADLTRLYLLGRNHQTLHTLCGMDEQFGQVSSIGMQPYVRRMIEYFIGDTRHAYLSLLEGRRLRAELVRIGSS